MASFGCNGKPTPHIGLHDASFINMNLFAIMLHTVYYKMLSYKDAHICMRVKKKTI